jgi:predicted RNase H-like HicB family nuclease
MKTKTVKVQLAFIQETVETAIKEAADNLLDDLVECDPSQAQDNLLEVAIALWLEDYIENLPLDIEHHLHKSAKLQKLIFQSQLQSDYLLSEVEKLTSEKEIKSDL